MFAEYKKIIPFITIDETARKQVDLDLKEKAYSELLKTNEELMQMKERNDILWNEYKKNSRSCNPDNAELITE